MKIESAHDVFWLARYAHNTIDPLITAAQQYDPSATLENQMSFCHADSPHFGQSHLTIIVRAKSQPNRIMAYSTSRLITTPEQVDAEATKVQAFIDAEQAKIEEEHDSAALYAIEYNASLEAADSEADAAWELQQDRIRERADIERDEHDHDIELQNVAAGN